MLTLLNIYIKQTIGNIGHWWQMAAFFLLCLLLFPLASEQAIEQKTAISFILIAVWLSSMVNSGDFFVSDFTTGGLEIWLNADLHPFIIIIVKIINHWLACAITLLPLILLSAVFFQLSLEVALALCCVVFIGLLSLSFLLAFGESLLLISTQSAFLLPVVIFPFMISTVIFASQTVFAVQDSSNILFPLSLLSTQVALNFILTPWLIILALKLSLQNA